MKCHECYKELNDYEAIPINADGDFACSKRHKKQYEKRLDEISKMSEYEFLQYVLL